MNKPKKATSKKHRKAEIRRKNATLKNPSLPTWIYAVGRIPEADLPLLKRNIGESELRKVSTVSHSKLDPGFIRVVIRVREIAGPLLEGSLSDGLLRHWSSNYRLQTSVQ